MIILTYLGMMIIERCSQHNGNMAEWHSRQGRPNCVMYFNPGNMHIQSFKIDKINDSLQPIHPVASCTKGW